MTQNDTAVVSEQPVRRWVPVDQLLRQVSEEDTDTAARWGDQGRSRTPRRDHRLVTLPPERRGV